MPLIILLAGITLLVILILWARLNAFLAFLLVSILVGLLLGLELPVVLAAIQKGMGDTLGGLVIIIGFGAILGKLVADSGAAQRIASWLRQVFGKRYLVWAFVMAGFIVGIPLFYGVGFVLMVPLVFTIAARYNIPAVYLGVPMLAALSVTHGFLPPHPGPAALVGLFGANMGATLLYGTLIGIPAIILAGPVFGLSLKKYRASPLKTFVAEEMPVASLPGIGGSLLTAFLPVILIAAGSLAGFYLPGGSSLRGVLTGLGDPAMAMILAVLFAMYILGFRRGRKMQELMGMLSSAVADIAMILLIIAGAGALKAILDESGISLYLAEYLGRMDMHPLLLAWSISAVIRICVGSATVAALTTAGIMAPVIIVTGADPNLMVLATGAGSLIFSHVNDSGFWLFKEYFNLSVKETLLTWSVMETIIAFSGLAGVMVLDLII
ncbi:Gnt-I system high-affinity gluconate transporter [Anseongella ginsenosidimutans]|uniref:Gnt-I system high-affinity gluconate transporter n=1 Tax=Anseongella ginsenosidimutans TaxID=496056 RepID=A0A4R3KSD4_9SPHI|nr:gluconate:H+ symporter [Anseongella ginsenosidimutans]QEC52677.1 gluconate transporter [Anseongella ginsenosidimutans]TCS86605.1 Gnt-I system high-affinity gluconate transporter [Anseongella ginsenosidimutans]